MDFVRTAPDGALPVGPDPWAPFKTKEDFEFTELVLGARMSKAEINAMISLLHRCIGDKENHFTLSSYDEMHRILAMASEQLPKVCIQTSLCFISSDHVPSKFEKHTFSEPYKEQQHKFDVWVCPVWVWLQHMLQSPDLIQHFVWDACHMSKFDEKSNSWV